MKAIEKEDRVGEDVQKEDYVCLFNLQHDPRCLKKQVPLKRLNYLADYNKKL